LTASPAARTLAGLLTLLLVVGIFLVDELLGSTVCTKVFFATVILLALHETYGLFAMKGRAPATGIGLGAAVGLVVVRESPLPEATADLVVVAGLFVALFATAARLQDRALALDRIASTVAGFVYAAWLPSAALDILDLPAARPESALHAAYWVVLVAKSADIGGYLVGRMLGRTRLIPSVSPNKTVEGAAGALVFSVLAAIVLARAFRLEAFSPLFSGLAGAAIGVAAMLGDLVESLLKRSAGVKDSSRRWRAFGGVLDLLDSLIVALPTGLVIVQARGL
jgi:phosphatidate cytidylyltransferase